MPVLERRFASLDSLPELEVGTESEHRQTGEPDTLLFAPGSVDDGLPFAVDLVDPEARGVLQAAARSGAEKFSLHPLGEFAQIGGHRIVADGRDRSEQQ